ncbi:MAG: ABC transporter ATP-binding protein [Ruminococcaceae bacterium]|nr:ABC transporter ATP-binding protein [Oscillospiraceae bacterium]
MKDKQTVIKVLRLVKPYSPKIFLSLFCSLLSVTAQLLIPYFSGKSIDFMLGQGKTDFDGILTVIVIIGITVIIAAISQHLFAVCNNKISHSVCRDLRNSLSDKLHRLPVSYLDSHPSGDLVSRMVSDIDTFSDGLLMGFTQLFTGVITIGATLVLMLVLNGAVALSVLILTPMSFLVAKFITSRTHRFFTDQAKIRGEQTALINELVEGQNVVKAFGHEEESLSDFDEINVRLGHSSLFATFFSSLTNPSTRLVNNIVYAVVALIGSLYALTGAVSVGQVSIFLSYASQYAKPFNEISGVITELQNALTCAKRVFDLLGQNDMKKDTDNPATPPVTGSVELKKVSFSYTPDRPLISNLSLKVEPGSRVAIVGPTGCGKTTLINLLMRFYDVDSGEILVDGENIQNLTREELRSRYGMVLQDTWLSESTVRENITYGKPDATDEEIISAAKSAHAHSFIRRLPDGYDTVIKSDSLSAGQKQLLCIARAMLCLPPMLILDEATSSIDTRTEMKIQDAFSKMMKGRTSFIVAHRLSTIREADIILVMNDGHVVEQGNHETLMKKNGFYAKLYNSQFEA